MQRANVDWNEISDFYNMLAFSELADTDAYLDAIGLTGGESVLDVCCGPGRISMLAAKRGCRVTGIDSAERMLAHARENAQAAGVAERCRFDLLDWNCALPGQNVQIHDVVIASRCGAMMDIEKLSALACEKVAVQIFADAPSIPQIKNVLLSGCGDDGAEAAGPGRSPMPGAPMPPVGVGQSAPSGMPGRPGAPMGGAGKPAGPGMPPAVPAPRRMSAYKAIIDKVYDAGFDPNVRIMPERFRKMFATPDEACAWVCKLDTQRSAGNEARVAANIAPLLRPVDGGVELLVATAAAIIWWDVRGAASSNPWIMGLAE